MYHYNRCHARKSLFALHPHACIAHAVITTLLGGLYSISNPRSVVHMSYSSSPRHRYHHANGIINTTSSLSSPRHYHHVMFIITTSLLSPRHHRATITATPSSRHSLENATVAMHRCLRSAAVRGRRRNKTRTPGGARVSNQHSVSHAACRPSAHGGVPTRTGSGGGGRT
jgi:hypothetical protein